MSTRQYNIELSTLIDKIVKVYLDKDKFFVGQLKGVSDDSNLILVNAKNEKNKPFPKLFIRSTTSTSGSFASGSDLRQDVCTHRLRAGHQRRGGLALGHYSALTEVPITPQLETVRDSKRSVLCRS